MDAKNFVSDAIEATTMASLVESQEGDMIDGGSKVNGYCLALGFVLVMACKRLEITDKDEINRSVVRAMHALGFSANGEPLHLRKSNDERSGS